ncbi:MAG TPA: VOC family protein [Bacteroidia bacterium]|jgi:hypothetical protein|nr:VOC family protein [Bacteroidia bacterium]
MKLNHLNLTVTNVAEAIVFFETYFNFKCGDVKGDNLVAVLTGSDGFELVLMSSSMNQKGNITYPDAFHIGFKLDGPNKVNELYKKLKEGGVSLEREPKKIRDSFGFYFYFENIMIEVGTI